jgi:hypothetical protein
MLSVTTVTKPTVMSVTKVTNAIGNHGNISHKERAELQLHSFLSPALDGGISSQLHAPAVLPSVNSLRYPQRLRLGGPQSWSVLPLPGFERRTVQSASTIPTALSRAPVLTQSVCYFCQILSKTGTQRQS